MQFTNYASLLVGLFMFQLFGLWRKILHCKSFQCIQMEIYCNEKDKSICYELAAVVSLSSYGMREEQKLEHLDEY